MFFLPGKTFFFPYRLLKNAYSFLVGVKSCLNLGFSSLWGAAFAESRAARPLFPH